MIALRLHSTQLCNYGRISNKLDSAPIDSNEAGVIADTKPVALIKPTGKGKNTMANAIPKSVRYCKDQMTVNHVNIKLIKGTIEKEGTNVSGVSYNHVIMQHRNQYLAGIYYLSIVRCLMR